jgi:hypothetical protein
VGSLLLWVCFKKELHGVRRTVTVTEDRLSVRIQELAAAVELLREERASKAAAALVPSGAFNQEKRDEALRMHRQNQSVGEIADALRLPRSEVEFLLKVDRLLNPAV